MFFSGQAHLKVKSFATSRNAVMTQLWVYLLLSYVKFGGLNEMLRVQLNLFDRRDLCWRRLQPDDPRNFR